MDTNDIYGINCDDDGDCVGGSGSGDGPMGGLGGDLMGGLDNEGTYYHGGTDSKWRLCFQ